MHLPKWNRVVISSSKLSKNNQCPLCKINSYISNRFFLKCLPEPAKVRLPKMDKKTPEGMPQ